MFWWIWVRRWFICKSTQIYKDFVHVFPRWRLHTYILSLVISTWLLLWKSTPTYYTGSYTQFTKKKKKRRKPCCNSLLGRSAQFAPFIPDSEKSRLSPVVPTPAPRLERDQSVSDQLWFLGSLHHAAWKQFVNLVCSTTKLCVKCYHLRAKCVISSEPELN